MDPTSGYQKHALIIESLVRPLHFAGQQLDLNPVPIFNHVISEIADALMSDRSCVQLFEERGEEIDIEKYISKFVNVMTDDSLNVGVFFKLMFQVNGNRMFNPLEIHSAYPENSNVITLFSFDEKKADEVDFHVTTPFPRDLSSELSQGNLPSLPIAFIFQGCIYHGMRNIGSATQETLDNIHGMETSLINANSILTIRLRSPVIRYG